jgi:hypothetical protein
VGLSFSYFFFAHFSTTAFFGEWPGRFPSR